MAFEDLTDAKLKSKIMEDLGASLSAAEVEQFKSSLVVKAKKRAGEDIRDITIDLTLPKSGKVIKIEKILKK